MWGTGSPSHPCGYDVDKYDEISYEIDALENKINAHHDELVAYQEELSALDSIF